VIAYPIATVSDEDKEKASQRLENYLIKKDEMKGEHLDFKAIDIKDTGVEANIRMVLNEGQGLI